METSSAPVESEYAVPPLSNAELDASYRTLLAAHQEQRCLPCRANKGYGGCRVVRRHWVPVRVDGESDRQYARRYADQEFGEMLSGRLMAGPAFPTDDRYGNARAPQADRSYLDALDHAHKS